MKKGLLFVLFAILIVALLGACGGQDAEEAVVGTWQCQDNSQPHAWVCTLVFDADGRFVDADGDAGDFVIDGDTLTLNFDEFMPEEFTFRIRSNRLTLTNERIHVILTKQ